MTIHLMHSDLYTQGYGFEVDKLYEVLLEIRLDCVATTAHVRSLHR